MKASYICLTVSHFTGGLMVGCCWPLSGWPTVVCCLATGQIPGGPPAAADRGPLMWPLVGHQRSSSFLLSGQSPPTRLQQLGPKRSGVQTKSSSSQVFIKQSRPLVRVPIQYFDKLLKDVLGYPWYSALVFLIFVLYSCFYFIFWGVTVATFPLHLCHDFFFMLGPTWLWAKLVEADPPL